MVPGFGRGSELSRCVSVFAWSHLEQETKGIATTISEDVEEMGFIDQSVTPSGLPENTEKNSLF